MMAEAGGDGHPHLGSPFGPGTLSLQGPQWTVLVAEEMRNLEPATQAGGREWVR